jgi:hypothetical protein
LQNWIHHVEWNFIGTHRSRYEVSKEKIICLYLYVISVIALKTQHVLVIGLGRKEIQRCVQSVIHRLVNGTEYSRSESGMATLKISLIKIRFIIREGDKV